MMLDELSQRSEKSKKARSENLKNRAIQIYDEVLNDPAVIKKVPLLSSISYLERKGKITKEQA